MVGGIEMLTTAREQELTGVLQDIIRQASDSGQEEIDTVT